MIDLLLVATQYMVILPGGTREMWDRDPAGKVPAGAQICTWSPKADEPKDPYLYVRHHSGQAVYQKPAEVPDTSPHPQNFLCQLAEDADLSQGGYAVAERIAKCRSTALRRALWAVVGKTLDETDRTKIRECGNACNLGLE